MTEGKTAAKVPPKKTAKPKPKAAPKKLRDERAFRVTGVRDRILYPADDAQLARLVNGDKVPRAERKMKVARTGDVVDDLPATSVPWLLDRGWIEPAKAAPKPKASKAGGDE